MSPTIHRGGRRVFCALLALLSCLMLASCRKAGEETAAVDACSPILESASDEATPLPPQVPEKRISFFATGDNLIHTGFWKQANRNAGGDASNCRMDSPYDFKPFYENLSEMLDAADISFLNQETLVAADESGAPSNYPTFNTPRACGDAMVELGFDVVNIANNHMLDMGPTGLLNSIEYWRTKEGVVQVGAYLDEADFSEIRVVEREGVRVAFLAYAEDPNNSGRGLGTPLSVYQPYSSLGLYVAALNEDVLRQQVEAARSTADFVVVAVHWGTENSTELSSVQKRYAALCAELGVDLVLGSHPHVLQTVEWIESDSAAGGRTLVVYSLGNMVSMMNASEKNMLGAALTLDFVKCADTCYIDSVVMTPTVSHCDVTYRDVRLILLEDYSEELYSRHYIHRHCETEFSDFDRIMREEIPREFWGTADYGESET